MAKWSKTRRHPRFIAGGRKKGRVTGDYEASLINISQGGALIEHAEVVVRPGTISFLELELQGKSVSLRSRVAWSIVKRPEKTPDGEQALVYHTGLEFIELPEDTRQTVCDYIQSIIEEGKAVSTDGGPVRRWYTCKECSVSLELADTDVRPVSNDSRTRPVQAGDLFYHDHPPCEGTLVYTSGGPFVPWTSPEEN